MTLHPVTHFVIAAEFALTIFLLPLLDSILFLNCCFVWTLIISQHSGSKLTGPFLKVLGVAAFFLFLLHGVSFNPLGISTEGLQTVVVSFRNIATPFVAILYLSSLVKSEQLYALLIDVRLPPVMILIIFKTLWLVPRFVERIDEVLTAQKLRGMRIDNVFRRARAVIPTLTPIFSSMLGEISDNALVITMRGFLHPGVKTHLYSLRFRAVDYIFMISATLISAGFVW